MKLAHLIIALILAMCSTVQAAPLVLTFDDIPTGHSGISYYADTYGVNFSRIGYVVVDHSASSWGIPHSGSNVLMKNPADGGTGVIVQLKDQTGPLGAYSLGAYFGTEYGATLQMVGKDLYGNPCTPWVTIGGADQACNNIYVEVSSTAGDITDIIIVPVSTGALDHFCMDDVTVDFVPEPSGLLALAGGLAGLCGMIVKRRRS